MAMAVSSVLAGMALSAAEDVKGSEPPKGGVTSVVNTAGGAEEGPIGPRSQFLRGDGGPEQWKGFWRESSRRAR